MSRLKICLSVVTAAALLTAVGCSPANLNETSSNQANAVGKSFGSIELVPLGYGDSQQIPDQTVLRQLPERITMLHFWGTWCPPCRAEYPELAALLNEYGDEVGFLSVSCEGSADDTYETLSEKTDGFLTEHGLESAVYCDPRELTRAAFGDAAGQSDLYYPTSILLDGDHQIIAIWEGFDPANLPKMRSAIDRALAESTGAST